MAGRGKDHEPSAVAKEMISKTIPYIQCLPWFAFLLHFSTTEDTEHTEGSLFNNHLRLPEDHRIFISVEIEKPTKNRL